MMTTNETITQERRTRLSLILCRRAANETSRKLANTLVKTWFMELGLENCNCDRLEEKEKENGQI